MRPLALAVVLLVAPACSADPKSPGEAAPADSATDAAPADSATDVAVGVDAAVSVNETGATCTDPPVGSVEKVAVSELKALLESGAKIAVIDVREPAETDRGIIAGALLYPWISGVFKAKHTELPNDRPLYVICGSGTRSAQATAFLASNGHACVHDTTGGMSAWTAAAYPTIKP